MEAIHEYVTEMVPGAITHKRNWLHGAKPFLKKSQFCAMKIIKNFPKFYITRIVHYFVRESPQLVPILSQDN
jgi:hypothetical protein